MGFFKKESGCKHQYEVLQERFFMSQSRQKEYEKYLDDFERALNGLTNQRLDFSQSFIEFMKTKGLTKDQLEKALNKEFRDGRNKSLKQIVEFYERFCKNIQFSGYMFIQRCKKCGHVDEHVIYFDKQK